jgi:hypothetical protein
MRDYWINLAAQGSFVAVVVAMGWLLVSWRRRQLLRFFGVVQRRRLRIYCLIIRTNTFHKSR